MIIPILWIEKLQHSEDTWLVQIHTVSQWQNWEQNPGVPALSPATRPHFYLRRSELILTPTVELYNIASTDTPTAVRVSSFLNAFQVLEQRGRVNPLDGKPRLPKATSDFGCPTRRDLIFRGQVAQHFLRLSSLSPQKKSPVIFENLDLSSSGHGSDTFLHWSASCRHKMFLTNKILSSFPTSV